MEEEINNLKSRVRTLESLMLVISIALMINVILENL
jgi:hypothetical protein